ncbi:MAG: hypothetical protein R3E92_03175 [Burkholderiaceae bacterium]
MFGGIDKAKAWCSITHDLDHSIQLTMQKMQQEVEGLDENRLLNTPPEDLQRYLVEKHGITPITLLRDREVRRPRGLTRPISVGMADALDRRPQPPGHVVAGERVESAFRLRRKRTVLREGQHVLDEPTPRCHREERRSSCAATHLPISRATSARSSIEPCDIEQHLGWQRPVIDAHN